MSETQAPSLSSLTGLHIEDYEDEKANLALIFDRYKESIKSLPKTEDSTVEGLYMYQDFWYPSKHLVSIETLMASQEVFHANPTDIYLATQPKSGTTWIKALAFAIVNRKRYTNIPTHPLLLFNPQDLVPLIETEILRNKPTYMDANSTRLFSTHTPYTSLPQSILDSRCRLVYLCRNPKDVLVSMVHFSNKLSYKTKVEDIFETFSKGVFPCGPYWDHVKGYYKASVDYPERVLFLTYENLKRDTVNNVKRLADFLGYPFTVDEESKGAVEEIVNLCSFKSLSDANKHGTSREGVPKEAFFREGKIGDGSNHLTEEMIQILDGITKEKFNGLNISF